MIFEKKFFLKSVLICTIFGICASFNSIQMLGTLQSSNVTSTTPIGDMLDIVTGSDSVTFIDNLAKSFVSLSTSTVHVDNLTKALNVFVDSSGNVSSDGQQALSVLSADIQTALLLNIKLLLYGFASGLVDDLGVIKSGTSSALANRLKNTIANMTTSVGVLPDDTFAHRKIKLVASLKAYAQRIEPEAFQSLITQGNLLSLSGIVGTCGDSPQTQGLIGRIVLERMQEDSSGLRNLKNQLISDTASPSILEDPSTSWLGSNEYSVNNLISMTQTNLTAFLTTPGQSSAGDITAEKIRSLCQKLRSNLLKPITFEERVAAISSISNDRSLDTIVVINNSTDNSTILSSIASDVNYQKFLGTCNRLINSLSASSSSGNIITQAVRQSARDAIDGYRINNRIPQGSDLDRIIASLSRSSISSEILQEGDVVSFQMFQTGTGKFSYLSVDQSSSDAAKIITTSEKAMGAARFLVGIYNQDNIVLEWLSDNTVSGDLDYMKNRSGSSFYYLGISDDGELTLSTKTSCFLKDKTIRSEYFSSVRNKFYFQAFGGRQKLSLKNVENNGFLTCCADGIFRTVSPGDNKPFSLSTNPDGSLNQSMNSSFNAIPVLETARMLAAGRSNFFLIKYNDITLPKNKYLMTNATTEVPTDSTLISSTTSSTSATTASKTIPSALNIFSKALELATNPAEISGRALLLDELLFFLESVRNNQTTYDYLRAGAITNSSVGTNNSSEKLDRIITNFGQAFSSDLAADSELKKGYNNLTSIWNAIKSTQWRDKTVPSNSPLDGQTVAFKYIDKFLTVLPVKDVNGKITYELFLTKTNPANPATHFYVVSKDGLFGFTSPIAGKDLYLAIKPDGSYSQSSVKQVSELYFTNLVKINSIEQPFELVSNFSRQFVLNSDTGGKFKISSQPSLTQSTTNQSSFLGIWDTVSDITPVMIHTRKTDSSFEGGIFFSSTDTNVISAAVVPISDLHKVLGFADLIADDAARINAYASVLDSITNLDDLSFWCNEVKTFIVSRKDNFDNWNKFLTDAVKTKAMTDLFTKLNAVVSNVKSTDKVSATTLQTDLKTSYDTDVTIPLTDYGQPNTFLAIKWFDSNNTPYYLKANKTVSNAAVAPSVNRYDGVVPTANSVADPDVRIRLIVESDNSVKIRFENSGLYLFVSDAGVLSLTSETTEAENKTKASSFIFEGTINSLDIKLNSGDLLAAGKYIGVKSLTGKVECYPGLETTGKTGPLKTQQIFAIESLSASDIKIINARNACDLLSPTTQALTNETLLPLLRNRVSAYSTIAAEIISMKNSSIDDQKLFVDEFKLFMTQATTLIDGKAWIEMTGDKELSRSVDNLLILITKFPGITDSAISSVLAMTTSLWQDGFSGKSAFANGDIVSISFKPNSTSPKKYFNVSKFTFNGNDLMQLSQSDTFFSKSNQFIVSTFKNQLVFQSVLNPGQYISGKLVSEKDKNSPPLSRMKLISLPVNKSSTSGFNFTATDPDSLSCIFELEKDGTLQSLNIVNPNSEGGNKPAKIVVDPNDMNFVKLDSSLSGQAVSSAISNFEIKKLSPLDQQLTNAYLATTVKDALAIFTTILEQNYINSSNTNEAQEDIFTMAVASLFQSYRSNNALWTAFTIDPNSAASLQKFLTLIDSSIKSDDNKNKLIASTRGDALLDMTVYSGTDSFISIAWQDPNDSTTYFMSKKDGEMTVGLGSSERLTSVSQLHVNVPNSKNKGQCYLYFDITSVSGSSKKVYYLSSTQSALNLTEVNGPDNPPENALLFEVYFSGSKMYFKNVSSSTDPNSATFLSVEIDTSGNNRLILSSGSTSISGMIMPTTLQLFEVTQVSDFDRKISVAWASSSPADSINYYNGLIVQNMLPGNVSTLIESIKKFVDKYTTDETRYNLINNNSTTKTSLLSLLVNLGKAVGKDALLMSKIDAIRASWSEGFTGSIDKNLPTEGDVVMFVDLNNSSNILKIESVPFQGNNLYQLKSFNDDQVNTMAHFIVHTHKNMYGFESVAFPGYYLSLNEIIEPQTNNGVVSKVLANPENIDPSNRLTFVQLGNNALGQPIKIGDLGSEKFIFMFNPSPPGSKSFNLRSRLDEVNSKILSESNTADLGKVIIDNSDYGFARINRFKVDQNQVSNLNITFISVTNLHKKLAEIKSLSTDKDILAAYYSILTNNYVINANTTDLFGKSLQSYLSGKTASAELWKQFSVDIDSAKIIAQILVYLGKNPALFDQVNKNITSIVSKGFVENLKDGDYITLSWGSFKSSTWSLKVRFDSSDKKTDSAKLSSVLSSYPSADSVFRIKFVTYQNKQYIQLIYEKMNSNGDSVDYAVSVNDVVSGTLARNTAGIIPAPKLSDSSITKTLFFIVPTANTVSFQAYSSNGLGGFLSIGTKDINVSNLTYHDVATVTEQSKLAGTIVGKIRNPGQQELFSVKILNKVSKELVSMSTPIAGSVGDAIASFINYPTYYQQNMQISLANAPAEDKASFIFAIDQFVQSVVASESISATISAGVDDKAFASLISATTDLGISDEQTTMMTKDLELWKRGYSKLVSEYKLPNHGSGFLLALAGSGVNNDSSKNLNEKLSSYSKILYSIEGQLDGVFRLGTTNLNTVLQDFVDQRFSDDEIYEKFILTNDPFIPAAAFHSQISRETFGMLSDIAQNKNLTVENVSFDQNKLNLNDWQKAVALFSSADFNNTDSSNSALFSIIRDESNSDQFVIKNKAIGASLFVDPNDGLVRVFRRTENTVTLVADSEGSKFIFVPISDFYNQILAARNSKADAEMITNYQKAMFAIKGQQELNWMVEELIRFVAKQKVNRKAWDTFSAKKDLVTKFLGLIDTFKDTFITQSFGSLVVEDRHVTMLGMIIDSLSGNQPVKFLTNIVIENKVLTFDQSFANLKTRLNNLKSDGVNSFMTDINNLILRKTELVLDDDLKTANNSFVGLSDWLELVCPINPVLKKSGQSKNFAALADSVRQTYTYSNIANPSDSDKDITTRFNYSDLINNAEFMVDNISGFSAARTKLFVNQVAKLIHPTALMIALSDGIGFAKARQVIRSAISNQMSLTIEDQVPKDILEKSEAWIARDATIESNYSTGSYGYYLELILSKLSYPLENIKGKQYTDLVDKLATAIKSKDSSVQLVVDESTDQFYDILSAWNNCIWTGLENKDDVKNMLPAGTTITDALFLSMKKTLVGQFINLVKTVISWVGTTDSNKQIVDKYNKFISDVVKKTGVSGNLSIPSQNSKSISLTTQKNEVSTSTSTTQKTKLPSLAPLTIQKNPNPTAVNIPAKSSISDAPRDKLQTTPD